MIIPKGKSNWDTFEQYRTDGGSGKRAIGLEVNQGVFCSLCGAWRGAYGLEPTPEMYVQHTIEILREIRRVLRKDGEVFWNIGDSYFGDHTIRTASKQAFLRKGDDGYEAWLAPQTGGSGTTSRRSAERIYPWKPKDLCLIPFRVAIAAQEDGWVIRSIIIWSKPNPMPESVRDRPTKSHEYIIMMTKAKQIGRLPLGISSNDRHWLAGVIDGEGCIRVAKFHNSYGSQILVGGMHKQFIERVKNVTGVGSIRKQDKGNGTAFYNWSASYLDADAVIKSIYPLLLVKKPEAKVALSLKTGIPHSQLFELSSQIHQQGYADLSSIPEPKLEHPIRWTPYKYYWDADAVREPYTEPLNRWGGPTLKRDTSKTAAYKEMQNIGNSSALRVGRPMRPDSSGRNIRTVWEFPTMPYPEAHFAVFPEELPRKCILAATPPKCCAECGAPWVRVTEISRTFESGSGKAGNKPMGKWADQEEALGDLEDDIRAGPCVSTQTLGWRPTCKCEADTKPSLVLDPFAGAGTVGKVAKELGRKAILIDISEEYCELARKRVEVVSLPMLLGL